MNAPIARGAVLAPATYGPFSAADVAAYALASLDDNALHVDPAIAAKAGLPRPPVHGMLLMGCFESYLGAWRPGAVICRIAGKFIKPVLVGESIEITGKVVQAAPGAPAILRLMVKAEDGALACLAEASIRP